MVIQENNAQQSFLQKLHTLSRVPQEHNYDIRTSEFSRNSVNGFLDRMLDGFAGILIGFAGTLYTIKNSCLT